MRAPSPRPLEVVNYRPEGSAYILPGEQIFKPLSSNVFPNSIFELPMRLGQADHSATPKAIDKYRFFDILFMEHSDRGRHSHYTPIRGSSSVAICAQSLGYCRG